MIILRVSFESCFKLIRFAKIENLDIDLNLNQVIGGINNISGFFLEI